MRTRYFIFFFLMILIISCKNTSSVKTETFKVWGNCEKCKKTIEMAASLDGVKEHEWNVDSRLMTVTFDTTKISLKNIQLSIAKSGYDNDTYYGDDYAYGKLEECCQYDRKPFELE